MPVAPFGVELGVRRLELAQDVVSELDRICEIVEAAPVLGQSGYRQGPR
jgi:hypothetical protein